MFWSLIKKIDQNKISAEEARIIYDEIFNELDEEQQELLENKIAELEEEEHYWEISKRIVSKEFYDDLDEDPVEEQLQEYDEYPFADEDDNEPEEK